MLSRTALDHVTSGGGAGCEREVEATLLGICEVLSDEIASGMTGIADPRAGTLEVWSRFVDPGRFASVVRASGLGDAALRRCGGGRRPPPPPPPAAGGTGAQVEAAAAAFPPRRRTRDAVPGRTAPPPPDVDACAYVQSLSILRTIAFRCHGSPRLIASAMQRRRGLAGGTSPSPPRGGIASYEDARSLIEEAEEDGERQCDGPDRLDVDGGVASLLEPFLRVVRAEGYDERWACRDLELLCTQTILLLQRPGFSIESKG
jgi:hypothetical protein